MHTWKDKVLSKHARQAVADGLGRDAEQHIKAPAVVLLVKALLGDNDIRRVGHAARHVHCQRESAPGAGLRGTRAPGHAYRST